MESAQQTEPVEKEPMDLNRTLLRIRGFSDVDLRGGTLHGDPASTTSFALGQVNLFVTSDVSDKFKFLSEVVFEAGTDNVFGVDIERLLLTYNFNDYFNLSVGRYHTAIGFYNTAYHHSTWFQTATGRPFLFAFEDQGGILPIHNVGASLTGKIPSGRFGLHYVAEVGNGRAYKTPEPVQNTVDENSHKAVNFAVFARPDSIPGLQAGVSVYYDHLTPLPGPNIGEINVAAHAVYTGLSFEWLNEAMVIRHAQDGTSRVFHTPGPSFGLRYDWSEFVALKLQYDYTILSGNRTFSAVALQTGFTF